MKADPAVPVEPHCERCGHGADRHSLDDRLNLDPTDPATPFRCNVGLFAAKQAVDVCGCPDFVLGVSR